MTCAACGAATHVLVGGKCTRCHTDEQDQRAPVVRHLPPAQQHQIAA